MPTNTTKKPTRNMVITNLRHSLDAAQQAALRLQEENLRLRADNEWMRTALTASMQAGQIAEKNQRNFVPADLSGNNPDLMDNEE